MRKCSIAVAVLVAAGLSVVTTGAASAGEPDYDDPGAVIVTCEDGEPVVREPTEAERERFRARPAPPERARPVPARPERPRVEGGTRVLPDGGAIRVVPAEPGAPPPMACESHVGPRDERGEWAVPALPR